MAKITMKVGETIIEYVNQYDYERPSHKFITARAS